MKIKSTPYRYSAVDMVSNYSWMVASNNKGFTEVNTGLHDHKTIINAVGITVRIFGRIVVEERQ